MGNFAIVKGGVVINTVIWDGESDWVPDDGEVVAMPDGVSIGWSYAAGQFSAPSVPGESHEELVTAAESEKQSLLNGATATIAPLQDAVDLGIATQDEIEQLAAWKAYRVLLNRVDTSTAPNINWPEIPV